MESFLSIRRFHWAPKLWWMYVAEIVGTQCRGWEKSRRALYYHSAHLSEGVLQMSIFSRHWKIEDTAKYYLAMLKNQIVYAIWIDIRLKNLFKPQITLPTNQDGLQHSLIILYGPLSSLFMTSSDKLVASIHPLANSNGLHSLLKVKSKDPLKVSLGYHNFSKNWTSHNPC